MIYLASPYSHPFHEVRAARFEAARSLVARNFGNEIIFSPILYTHEMAIQHALPTDAESWKFFNNQMMNLATVMWVLKLQGWQESLGVQYEIQYAKDIGLPVEYIEA